MLPYLNRRYLKTFKALLLCTLTISCLLIYRIHRGPDIAVERRPPPNIRPYQCDYDSSDSFGKNRHIQKLEWHRTNLTERRALVLLESAFSRHGKLLIQILNASKMPYKSEPFSKNLPLLTTATRGRYSLIIIENYYKYLNMPKWNRQLLDKYCSVYKVPLISFLSSKPNDQFLRAKIKGSDLYIWQNQEISTLKTTNSSLHKIARKSRERVISSKEWLLFEVPENSKDYEVVLEAKDALSKSRGAVIRQFGKQDGVAKILFGHNITDWSVKLTFLDSLLWVMADENWGLDRFIQVDIDDIFVGARGTRMVKDDVFALLEKQRKFRSIISNFTFMMGFSGSYFENGDDLEDEGDRTLIEVSKNFYWFPHMWRHNHAHEHNGTYLESTMILNRQFAENNKLPVPFNYAIAPQHDGIYPVHEELYEAWKKHWSVQVTATEEYPHFKPASDRRAFIHKGIAVLPRQTCGLYTHTQFFHSYPDGFSKLQMQIQGGDLFFTVILNPISIFMTHQQNYAHDRLALYTFESLINFIRCWTNIHLQWQSPLDSAQLYFKLFPQERLPLWSNPCSDTRHQAILPPSLNCSNITLPNLLIVGPQKTGTTALSFFLQLHPNISTNRPIENSFEELQFFGGDNYKKGLEWYITKFYPAQVVFEKSATYFDNPEAAKQASALVPDANILVILYDPAKRAYSWYQHMKAHNDSVAMKSSSFDQVLDNSTDPAVKKLRQRCISGGRYTHHLDRWLEQYSQSKLILVDGEKLKESPVEILHEITKQIGLPAFDYESRIRFSPSKGYFCKIVDDKTKCLGAGKGRHYEPMSEELTVKLNRLFLPDNTALYKFLLKNKLPLPNWLPKVLE